MTLLSQTEEEMKHKTVFVDFPEDVAAKREATARHRGAFIHDSLRLAIEEVKQMGTRVPKELKQKLKSLYHETDWEKADDDQT